MAVPLTILDTAFRDEALLKGSQLLVNTLNTLSSLDELLDRYDTTSETNQVLDQSDEPVDRTINLFEFMSPATREFIEKSLEMLFSFGLLDVEDLTGFLETLDGLAKCRELN